MEWIALARALGALGIVLGLLWGALWIVRRYDIRLPGAVGGSRERRLELVERIALDQRRSVALIRRDGKEHLLLVGPEGTTVLETGIVHRKRPAPAASATPAPVGPATPPLETPFARLVDHVRDVQAAFHVAREETRAHA